MPTRHWLKVVIVLSALAIGTTLFGASASVTA